MPRRLRHSFLVVGRPVFRIRPTDSVCGQIESFIKVYPRKHLLGLSDKLAFLTLSKKSLSKKSLNISLLLKHPESNGMLKIATWRRSLAWTRHDSTPISDYRRRERCSSDHRRFFLNPARHDILPHRQSQLSDLTIRLHITTSLKSISQKRWFIT